MPDRFKGCGVVEQPQADELGMQREHPLRLRGLQGSLLIVPDLDERDGPICTDVSDQKAAELLAS